MTTNTFRKFFAATALALALTACQPPNGSSDGRYHTCGYITEDGVTEHLGDYLSRCGDTTLAGDTKEVVPG